MALVIGFTAWPWLARAVRAQSSSVRTREHIDVARLSGARSTSILVWDVLPYLLSYVVMAFVLQVSAAILFEATLSLLGLGPSGSVSLGIMLYWAIAWGAIRTGAWWAFVPPTLMLSIISFSLLMLQSSLDEVFNPRLRRGKLGKRRCGPRSPPARRSPQPARKRGGSGTRGTGERRSAVAPERQWLRERRSRMTRLLNAEHLRASYRTPDGREVTAVDDVSVYIDEGEVLGVAGESGCGKTTLGSILSLTARPPLYVDSGTWRSTARCRTSAGTARSSGPGVVPSCPFCRKVR